MTHAWFGVAACAVLLACSTTDSSDAGSDTSNGGGSNTGGDQASGGTTGGNQASGGSPGGGPTGGSSAGGGSGGGGGSTSSGCGNATAPTGVTNSDIQANGKARTYVLAVPDGYDANIPLPLVFAWHGLGGSGAGARSYFGIEQQSAGQAIFVYPNGLVVSLGDTGWDLTSNGDDVQLFDAIVDSVEQTYCIDQARIFSTGHSFGGYFSNALGCARAGVLNAIAPVAGGGPFQGTCSGAVAAWITHGSNDSVVAFSQGEGSRDHWLASNGCGTGTSQVTPTPCVAYDGCLASAALHWCPHDGGHEWPSFAGAGIWSFFASMP